jgi:nocturnin
MNKMNFQAVMGPALLAGVAIFLITRGQNKKKKLLLPPLSNAQGFPIKRPSPKTSDAYPNINSIEDLRRLAADESGVPSPLPPLLSRDFKKVDLNDLRVLQFNLLARGLSSPPAYGGFVMSPAASLHFDRYRRYRLMEEILRFEPDVVTLEELDQYDDFFQPLMNKFGYDSLYQPKLDAPTLSIWNEKMKEEDKSHQIPYNSDGCAIFWRRDILDGVECNSMNYKSKDGKPWSQVGVAVRLLNKKNKKTFVVACTHLKSKPPHEERRVQQITQLLDHVFSMRLTDTEPLILTGDFNADPATRVATPNVYETTLARMDSTYKLFYGEEPAFTTCKVRKNGESCHTIDYIFVSNGVRVTSCLSMPTYESLPKERIPTWSYPSDHLSIGADVNLWESTQYA